LQPLTPHTPQRHKGYIYATAHVHDVDAVDYIGDGHTRVDIDTAAGFQIAPGDDCDIEVANAYPWGSESLLFSDRMHQAFCVKFLVEGGERYKGTPDKFNIVCACVS
jgi:hypothetical protein